MKRTAAIERVAAGNRASVGTDNQVNTLGLSMVAILACAAGLWAAASLVGGMVASGGPVGLLADWCKAVLGM